MVFLKIGTKICFSIMICAFLGILIGFFGTILHIPGSINGMLSGAISGATTVFMFEGELLKASKKSRSEKRKRK